MPPLYVIARRDGRTGTARRLRVRAAGPRQAFERVRRERPEYAADQLILCGVAADEREGKS